MKKKLFAAADRLNIYSVRILVYSSLILFAVLSLMNLFMTTYFPEDYSESPQYRFDNILLFIALSLITIAVFLFLDKKIGICKIKERKLLCTLMIFTFLFCAGWVYLSHSYPVADRAYVSGIAEEFINGNYQSLKDDGYLVKYPHQLGIIGFIEIIYRIAGKGNYQAVQFLNGVAVSITFYVLYQITKLLFLNKKEGKEDIVPKLTGILLFGCWCAMFFSTYVYGNLFGLAFITLAVWLELLYFKTRRTKYIVISIICLCIGMLLKNNYSIVMVAMLIMLMVDFFNKKDILSVILAVIMFFSYILFFNLLFIYYGNRSDIQVSEGVPKIMWIAMGLQPGWFGEGTYNEYTVRIYESTGYDADKTAQIGKENIKQQLAHYTKNPSEAFRFFGKKIALQWTEPTYMSIWDSNCADNHTQEVSEFTQSIYTGVLHGIVEGFMNFYQSFIWVCAFVYVFLKRKQLNAPQMMLGMIIVGGFLFHIAWEAKSQYILQYFVFAIPYGAAGFAEILKISKRVAEKMTKKNGEEQFE